VTFRNAVLGALNNDDIRRRRKKEQKENFFFSFKVKAETDRYFWCAPAL
jgi:hypothetical protein